LIAGLGATGGVLLSRWLSHSLVSYLGTGGGTRAIDLTADWRVFGFIMLVAVGTCLIFGLSPALKATRTDPGKTMHAGGRSSTDAHDAMTLRRALVVVQVALSMVLVVGAVLFGRTLRNLATTDLGFRTGGIVAATVDVQRANIDRDALPAVYQQIVERMRAVPGIEHASEVFLAPLSGATWDGKIVVGGAAQNAMVNFNQIGAEYFRTMDIPLLEGRTFDATDRPGTPLRAVVNEAFARRYFGGRSPVGQTFQQEAQPGSPQPAYHIIGLVKNTKYTNLREPFAPIAYLSWTQESQPPPFVHVVFRSDLPLAALRGPLTQAVLGAAPGTSVAYRVVTNYISESLVTERLMATLSGFFGVLAMLIASIGLYGVMSYMVTRRKVEIGIRMALGANPADVIRMVLAESGMLLIAGVVVGASLAVAASHYAATLLFGLKPWDPASFAAAATTLALVSLLAAWLPARRASRLAPTVALREE
jgi:putative ABC transport system permease protein